MEWYHILILVLGILCAVALIALLIVVPALVYAAVFGQRQDRNRNLKYFSPDDFGLTAEELPLYYRGKKLYGAVYSLKPLAACEKLIIFAHGMGAGHCAYTTEIAYYCSQGYAVLAYDNLGCDRSEGEDILGFYAGAEAVVAAYIAAKKDERLKDKPIFLVGHSWGAYSALCAADRVKVDGVVAFSSFDSPSKIFCDLVTANANAFVATVISPAVRFLGFVFFGRYGNKSAVKAIENSKTPALLIWGEKDPVIAKKNSAACIAKGEKITSLILPDKKHNPYNTAAAEEKLAALSAALTANYSSEEEKMRFFEEFDFSAATEEDAQVMRKTAEFIESVEV